MPSLSHNPFIVPVPITPTPAELRALGIMKYMIDGGEAYIHSRPTGGGVQISVEMITQDGVFVKNLVQKRVDNGGFHLSPEDIGPGM